MTGPDVSVVMSVYNGAETVMESVCSVLSQEGVYLELIVINDGSTDSTAAVLEDAARGDNRVRLFHKRNEGLTRALIEGCEASRGAYVARIDAGDRMLPGRLKKQKQALDACPDAAFASCWTGFCGPDWEPLYIGKGNGAGLAGVNILPNTPGGNLSDGPSSHGSVMFRRATYESSGGYRWQFYYGQDWDLWYRLAERGRFLMVPEELFRVRLFVVGLSADNRARQAAIGRCSLNAFWSRRTGQTEAGWLEEASLIRPGSDGALRKSGRSGEGAHFIGEMLRRNGDPRCRRYFAEALRHNVFRPNTWCRLVQSLSIRVPQA